MPSSKHGPASMYRLLALFIGLTTLGVWRRIEQEPSAPGEPESEKGGRPKTNEGGIRDGGKFERIKAYFDIGASVATALGLIAAGFGLILSSRSMREVSKQTEAMSTQTESMSAQTELLRQQNLIAQRSLNVAALDELIRDLDREYRQAGGAAGLPADSARDVPLPLLARARALASALGPHQPEESPPPSFFCRFVIDDRNLSPERGWLLAALAGTRFKVTDYTFEGANLDGISLGPVVLSGADLRDADLAWTSLAGAYFAGNSPRTNLTRADLHKAILKGAHLAGAILERSCLYDTDLTGADLTGANLRNADLAGANLSGAILDGAVLCNARGLTVEQLRSAHSMEGVRIGDSLRQILGRPEAVGCAR